MAAYHPGIRLLNISTVHGNASLDKTTNNALSVLKAIGKHEEVTVYPGYAQALQRPSSLAPTEIHGESGLDGTDLLPKPATQADRSVSAVDAMAAALRATEPGTAWLVATGGLTNAGALFLKYPELAAHIKGLSIMGGSVGGGFTAAPLGKVDGVERIGNYTKWAEFNVLIDPEAAASLFDNEVLKGKTTLIALDLTHLVLATSEVQDHILYGSDFQGEKNGKGKTTLRTMLVELLNFFAATYRDTFGIVEGPPLHDPLAVAAALAGTAHEIPFYDFDPAGDKERRPERFDVKVVTEGTLEEALHNGAVQVGRTIATPLPPGVPGVRIPRGLDMVTFWKVIEECCQRADETNAKAAAAV
ncbi:inosine-uridine preferring nucleoside hydrolase [Pestalotiopsis sp. NC0098]|nr:inosine-uridine preferring nucleoside hydrolase [Pestalotiopsis sp. NC0098]